jgi:outer membrane lipoprotein LolB
LKRRSRRALLASALAATLGGCASVGAPPPELAGRIALRVEAGPTTPARSFSADFDLRGDARRGELRLTGPLGALIAHLGWWPGGAWLAHAEGRREYATLDALSEDLLGESLPLGALIDWLRARPWAGAPSVALGDGFAQLDWRVDVSQHAQGLIVARRDRAPAVLVRARLETPT